MKKIRVSVSTGYCGCDKHEEFEMSDDATEQEIKEASLDVLFDMIDWNYEEVEK